MTTDAAAVIEDEEVDIVVELVGGTSIAKDLTEQALRLGKPVVTANKALLADQGADLYALVDERIRGSIMKQQLEVGFRFCEHSEKGLLEIRLNQFSGF